MNTLLSILEPLKPLLLAAVIHCNSYRLKEEAKEFAKNDFFWYSLCFSIKFNISRLIWNYSTYYLVENIHTENYCLTIKVSPKLIFLPTLLHLALIQIERNFSDPVRLSCKAKT